MAYRRPASAFRNTLGSEEFPFEADRYILYVSLACPWANGLLQQARLNGLVGKLGEASGEETAGKKAPPLRLAVVHPCWQYTDPKVDAASEKPEGGLAGGVLASEPHAGWIFAQAQKRFLPLAVMKNGKAGFGLELPGSAEELCASEYGSDGNGELMAQVSAEALEQHGLASAFSTVDPSKHGCKSLRHLYEKCGGHMKDGVRATTPMVYDTKTDRVVSNESLDLAKALAAWGRKLRAEGASDSGIDTYPLAIEAEVDRMNELIYPLNNGVYRCGFANSQPAYHEAAQILESKMLEVEKHLAEGGPAGASRRFLAGDHLTAADIRLFNTLLRMDEVYVTYFKTYFASLFSPIGAPAGSTTRFPHLLRHTTRVFNGYPEVHENVVMQDIRNHYFTSHGIRNMFAVVPQEVGVTKKLQELW